MKRIGLLSAGLLATVTAIAAPPEAAPPPAMALESHLLETGWWSQEADAVGRGLQAHGFRWVSQDKAELRAARPGMTFLDFPVVESVVRFSGGKPVEAFLSLYNRGDVGRISDDKFEAFAAGLETTLAARAAVQGEDLGDALKRPGFRATSRAWLGTALVARLDTAWSRVRESDGSGREDRPEFVNLTLYPPGTPKEGMLTQRKAAATAADLAARVERRPDGEVLLGGVPMVDQGSKGYCAVATMERVLRYYGSEVNQHELAQQANSSGEEGTNAEALVKAFKGIGTRLGLRIDEQEAFDPKAFFDLVEDYNKLAKRRDRSEIQLRGMVSVAEVYTTMDPALLREVRLKSASRVEKFFKETRESIDRGLPVVWSVQLGLVEETPRLPQAAGGHMRLIIGYHGDKREILYTDSWGYGHELKRMPLDDAYLITVGRYVVEPRQ